MWIIEAKVFLTTIKIVYKSMAKNTLKEQCVKYLQKKRNQRARGLSENMAVQYGELLERDPLTVGLKTSFYAK